MHITGNNLKAEVLKTEKAPNGQNMLFIRLIEGGINVGDIVTLTVDKNNRFTTCQNHSATHLLQRSLKDVLGDEVNQAGSFVDNETLRFDTDEEAFFGMGQIAYFLMCKTKSKIKHDVAVPFLTSVYSESAKNEIFKLFVVKSYDIPLKWNKFNNLYAMVQEYRYPKKMNFECVFAGFLHNNFLLLKNNIEKNEEEV